MSWKKLIDASLRWWKYTIGETWEIKLFPTKIPSLFFKSSVVQAKFITCETKKSWCGAKKSMNDFFPPFTRRLSDFGQVWFFSGYSFPRNRSWLWKYLYRQTIPYGPPTCSKMQFENFNWFILIAFYQKQRVLKGENKDNKNNKENKVWWGHLAVALILLLPTCLLLLCSLIIHARHR